jgi:AcrR family transcriptional regulator
MRIRKSAEHRKAEIVDAALRLADELGPERLTTEAIAGAVGLTQPAIFRHFPKKQALWEAVATRIGSVMETRWAKAQHADATPLGQIRAVVAAQLRLIQTIPAIPAILFSRELHTRNQGLREAFFGLLLRFHRLLTNLATRARSAGELRTDLEPGDAAFLILGLVQGLAVRWSISGRAFDLAEEGSRLLEIQLHGFAGAPLPIRREALS